MTDKRKLTRQKRFTASRGCEAPKESRVALANSPCFLPSRPRYGVSLMEVMFSIMIVSVGLILIASLIPLASRQANDSYSLSRGAVMASNAASMAASQKWQDPSTNPWLVPDDVSGGGFLSFNGSAMSATLGLDATTSFCIDPWFWSVQPGAGQGKVPLCSNAEGAYRRARFPYYREDYDPTTDPSLGISGSAPAMPPTQARMMRVSYGSSFNPLVPMTARLAKQMCASRDDVVRAAVEGDKPFVRLINEAGRASSSNDFSWMITLSPNELRAADKLTNYYTMSTIVYRKRDRTFQAGKLTTSGVDYDPASPPQGERVALVTGSSKSTLGGGGFAVKLTANVAFEDRLRVGDWIMLSKMQANGRGIFRWYRVVAVSPSVIDGSSFAPNVVWTRDIHLAGSDWAFDTLPTIATLVSNVVTVYEQIVTIP